MLTPTGIYLYPVLAMGLSNATNIFKKCMRNIVDGLKGMVNIANDILVFATKYDRCVEHDFHLNPEKIMINLDSVPLFWADIDEIWSPNGC